MVNSVLYNENNCLAHPRDCVKHTLYNVKQAVPGKPSAVLKSGSPVAILCEIGVKAPKRFIAKASV